MVPTKAPESPEPGKITEGVSNSPTNEEERSLASIGYVGFLCILPLLKKDSQFCQWHGRQSLVLNSFIFFAVLIFMAIPRLVFIGALADLLELVLFLASLSAIALASSSARKGGMWKIPYISNYIDRVPKF